MLFFFFFAAFALCNLCQYARCNLNFCVLKNDMNRQALDSNENLTLTILGRYQTKHYLFLEWEIGVVGGNRDEDHRAVASM